MFIISNNSIDISIFRYSSILSPQQIVAPPLHICKQLLQNCPLHKVHQPGQMKKGNTKKSNWRQYAVDDVNEVVLDDDSNLDDWNEKSLAEEEVLQEEQSQRQIYTVEKSEVFLRFAEAIKRNLPHYSIANSLCALQKQIAALNFGFDDENQQQLAHKFGSNNLQENNQEQSIHLSKASAQPSPVPVKTGRIRERELLEREIAHLFITKGYGLTLIKGFTKHEMEAGKYNSLLSSIIRGTLRKLCDIMNRNLGQNIKNFEIQEENLLRSPLVNCRKWLTRSEQQTLFKIINIVYSMNQLPIYQDQVLTLYDRILKQLSKRSQNARLRIEKKKELAAAPHLPPNFNRFQTVFNPAKLHSNNLAELRPSSHYNPNPSPTQLLEPPKNNLQHSQFNIQQQPQPEAPRKTAQIGKFEKEIATLFVKYKNLDSVLLILKGRHKDVNWSIIDLHDEIIKMVRIGLKQLLKYRKEYVLQSLSVPSLSLNEYRVGQIINSPFAEETRVSLVKYLLQHEYTLIRTNQLVNMVNHTLTTIEQRRQ